MGKGSIGLLLLGLLAGCAGYYLMGAAPHEGVPPGASTYRLGVCTRVADKGPAEGPANKTWYVLTGATGLVMLELDNATHAGNEIRNTWSEANADYFFAYEEKGKAYYYVVPPDRSQPARRLAYAAGTYRAVEDGGHTRPEGTAESSCELTPAKE